MAFENAPYSKRYLSQSNKNNFKQTLPLITFICRSCNRLKKIVDIC